MNSISSWTNKWPSTKAIQVKLNCPQIPLQIVPQNDHCTNLGAIDLGKLVVEDEEDVQSMSGISQYISQTKKVLLLNYISSHDIP